MTDKDILDAIQAAMIAVDDQLSFPLSDQDGDILALAVLEIVKRGLQARANAHEPDDKPLDSIIMSIRARNVLDRLGARTIRQAAELTADHILISPGSGAKTLVEVRCLLAERGLQLAQRQATLTEKTAIIKNTLPWLSDEDARSMAKRYSQTSHVRSLRHILASDERRHRWESAQ